jgi:hypothetical protein
MWSSGRPPPQGPSQDPYAHWSWRHPGAAANLDNDCVRAMADSAYDTFIGNDSSSFSQASNMASYMTAGSRKYGWVGGGSGSRCEWAGRCRLGVGEVGSRGGRLGLPSDLIWCCICTGRQEATQD